MSERALRGDSPIRTIEDMRKAVLLLPGRLNSSLTALSNAAGLSLTVVDWAHNPEKRKTIRIDPVLTLLNACGHELVARPKGENSDLAVTQIRTVDDALKLVLALPMMTGRSLTNLAMPGGKGKGPGNGSLTVVGWANDPTRKITLQPLLTILNEAGFNVFFRKQPDTKKAARAAARRRD